MSNDTKAPKAAGRAKALRVTAKRPSFWRAGFEFGHQPRTLLLAELLPEQAHAIRNEGMLVVEEVTALPESPEAPPAA